MRRRTQRLESGAFNFDLDCRRLGQPRRSGSPGLAEFGDDALYVSLHLRACLTRIVRSQRLENFMMIPDRRFAQGGRVKVFLDLLPHRSMAPIPHRTDDFSEYAVAVPRGSRFG